MRLRYFPLNTHNALLSNNGRMSLFIGMVVLSAKSCFPPFNHWPAPLSLPLHGSRAALLLGSQGAGCPCSVSSRQPAGVCGVGVRASATEREQLDLTRTLHTERDSWGCHAG